MDRTGRLRLVVILPLAAVGLASALWGAWQGPSGWNWRGLALNLGTEIIGAVTIYVLLQRFVGEKEKKEDLIRQMGSRVQDVAIEAAEELRRYGWLMDGSLRGADLGGANLRVARLGGADLRKADLGGADLRKASLGGADLRGASLTDANLSRARLRGADLRKASLWRTYLPGASLADANLQGATLQEAAFYETTTLPDGTKWTPDTDMARFTDPAHSEFWRSNLRSSPACAPSD